MNQDKIKILQIINEHPGSTFAEIQNLFGASLFETIDIPLCELIADQLINVKDGRFYIVLPL